MVRIPVYFNLNGMHQVAIFNEMDDGTFRRTSEEPMRLLRDNIEGIGPVVGELLSTQQDHEQRIWQTPTVLFRHRSYSIYQFLREQLKLRKIYVLVRASRSGRQSRLDLHELILKPTASAQVRSLLSKKLIEAIDLDPDHVSAPLNEQARTIA
jgi:hypothetical protein